MASRPPVIRSQRDAHPGRHSPMKCRYLTLIALSFCLLECLPARGEVLEFTLDPARSRVGVSSGLAPDGASAEPQSPGSNTASYGGTIRVDLESDAIRILGGSFADAVPQAVPQQP